MKVLTKILVVLLFVICYSTITKAQSFVEIPFEKVPFEDMAALGITDISHEELFNVDVFKQDISGLVDEGGVVNIDEENNAYVQGATEIEYLSYPELQQPDYTDPMYSVENPRLIYDDPSDMEITPNPAQCPQMVVCPNVRKEAMPKSDFMYEMELDDGEEENL